MSHQLIDALAEKIKFGLMRKSYTTCSRWAENCRVMGPPFPGKWSFKYHPWAKAMHDSEAEVNVGEKSAQMGFTEVLLNRTFFNIDVRGMDCLYVLPAKTPDASDFSSGRFDPALELSPHLSNLFSDVKNKGHKRAGNTNLYIRGGRSRGGLKSIPVGCLMLDEVNEMPKDNIPLAMERQSGQLIKETWLISTPTIPKAGVDEYYQKSTQNHFFFRCPCCSKYIELKWPDSIVITADHFDDMGYMDSHYICYECKNILPQHNKHEYLGNNEWVKTHNDKAYEGWYINQMYSSTISPDEIALAYLKGLVNRADEQELFNSKLGLPHTVEGAGVTDEDISKCTKTYQTVDNYSGERIVTMGVDIGKWIHFEIDEWFIGKQWGADVNLTSRPRVLKAAKVLSFDDLDGLMHQYKIRMAVIDKFPETRKAIEFAMKFFGHVRLCSYLQGIDGKFIHVTPEDQANVGVDRTAWLDLSLGRFKSNSIDLPVDISPEYKDQIKAQVRVYDKDRNNNPVAYYVNADPDHFGHARNYAEIALPIAAKFALGTNQNIIKRVL